jgi:hypothetical protein
MSRFAGLLNEVEVLAIRHKFVKMILNLEWVNIVLFAHSKVKTTHHRLRLRSHVVCNCLEVGAEVL